MHQAHSQPLFFSAQGQGNFEGKEQFFGIGSCLRYNAYCKTVAPIMVQVIFGGRGEQSINFGATVPRPRVYIPNAQTLKRYSSKL